MNPCAPFCVVSDLARAYVLPLESVQPVAGLPEALTPAPTAMASPAVVVAVAVTCSVAEPAAAFPPQTVYGVPIAMAHPAMD